MIDITLAADDRGTRPPSTRFKAIFGGAFGNFVEWYDFAIYGFLAATLADQIFPNSDHNVSLLASFGAFAIGFIGRPIGALVLSPLADRYGRRQILAATIILAGIASVVIGLSPTYDQVGIFAPILVTASRFVQGIAVGGEFQIAASFINEHAPRRNRAFAASGQLVSSGIAVLVALGVTSAIAKSIDAAALSTWGWRVPFLIGGVLSVYGFFLRKRLPESPSFEKSNVKAPNAVAVLLSLKEYPREVLIVFIAQLSSVQYYIWLIFLPTYANLVGGLDRTSGFVGGLVATSVYIVAVPVFASLSDRIGRKPMLITAASGFLALSYPLLTALRAPLSYEMFLLVAITGATLVAVNNSVLGTFFTELFPTRMRASGIGIPYALCAAVFGGTAPVVSTWLNERGGPSLIAYYVMGICVVTLVTHIFITPETRGRSLD
jgi:MHS family alpha-ketoglutarate permease-like MFS transporter